MPNEKSLVDEMFDSEGQAEQTSTDDTQKEETKAADTEAETEEKPSDTEADTTAEETKPDLNTVFKELGLDGQFRDVEDVLRRVPDTNRYLTQVQQENAALKRAQAEHREDKLPPPFDPDRFAEDPLTALKAAGFIMATDVESTADRVVQHRLSEDRARRFIADTPDFTKMTGAMATLYQEHQDDFNALRPDAATKLLYLAARGEAAQRQITEPADEGKKSRAQTSGGKGGGKKKPSGEITKEEFENMSPDQMEKIPGIYGDE